MLDTKNYCVYLNNWPYIDNKGHIGMCCKNNNKAALYNMNIQNTPLKDLFNHPLVEMKRKIFLNNMIPEGCNLCTSCEDKGIKSFRQKSLNGLADFVGVDPVPFEDKVIRALDLRTGSTCNLTCVMCHPNDSSKWYKMFPEFAEKVTQIGENRIQEVMESTKPNMLNWAENPQSWENIFSSIDNNLAHVYLAGGEPFYIKNFTDYIEKLISFSPNANIEINTNATRHLTQKHLDSLRGKLKLRISIDGFNEADEYQRAGTTWDQKVAVMDEYYNNFVVESFDITISSLTIRSIPKLVEFLTQRYPDIKMLFRPVVNRKGLKINNLPLNLTETALYVFKDLNAKDNKKFLNLDQCISILESGYEDDKDILKRTVNYWDNIVDKKLSQFDSKLYDWILSD